MPSPTLSSGSPGSPRLFDNRYQLLERLGGGNFGEVWKARNANTGRVVALKLIGPNSTPDAAWQEATRLTSLESPSLVRVHGAALAVDVPYIDTEFMAGRDTSRVAGPLGIEPSTAVKWARQVAQGLRLCHDRRLLHRDVKPGNVLLDANLDARLGDFGVAAIMDANGTAAPHGDIEVRAPEVLAGGRCTPASDVYSLGVTLFAWLTGSLPYRFDDYDSDWDAFVAAASQGVPRVRDLAPHVGRSLGDVVAHATAPTNRYQDPREIDNALAKLPRPLRKVREIPPHANAMRCWEAVPSPGQRITGLHVCLRYNDAGSLSVETRRVSVRRQRVSQHCFTVERKRLLPTLRRTFAHLT